MKIDVADLSKVLRLMEIEKAVNVLVTVQPLDGLERLAFKFENLAGDPITVYLSGSNSGGFNFVTTTRRL